MNALPDSIGDSTHSSVWSASAGLKLRTELTTLFLQEAPSRGRDGARGGGSRQRRSDSRDGAHAQVERRTNGRGSRAVPVRATRGSEASRPISRAHCPRSMRSSHAIPNGSKRPHFHERCHETDHDHRGQRRQSPVARRDSRRWFLGHRALERAGWSRRARRRSSRRSSCLDISLPGMDGVEVLRHIRADPAFRHCR